jgi:HdeA/HdeB family protein
MKMNCLKYSIFGASIVLGMNTLSQAQVFDMSKITCAQLMSGTADSIESAIWISGYYSGLHKNTKLDPKVMKHNAETVVDACKASPDKTVMQTVDSILDARKKK